ncbi:hypothetical protein DFH09DRAFT_1313076 [Mycena vulgaris]|nr:hypothetical protein DFH09DRAFT_1313076 [Mycena vulgaris]
MRAYPIARPHAAHATTLTHPCPSGPSHPAFTHPARPPSLHPRLPARPPPSHPNRIRGQPFRVQRARNSPRRCVPAAPLRYVPAAPLRCTAPFAVAPNAPPRLRRCVPFAVVPAAPQRRT